MNYVRKIYLVLFTALMLSGLGVFAQGQPGIPGIDCNSAGAFCSEIPTISFEAGVGSGSFGSSIGCLSTTPNPAWYVMQVGQSGRINIHMITSPLRDLDFACWGPFTSPTAGCGNLNFSYNSSHGPTSGANPADLGGYPLGNLVDCSFSAATEEYVHIPNAVQGQWYLLLITNYSNAACNISFGSDPTSTGNTNCAIMTPPPIGDTVCIGDTAILRVSNPVTGATYTWEGPNDFYTTTGNSTIVFPNATPAIAGQYSLTITHNGRTGDPVFCNLIVNSKPTLVATTDTICVGEVATVSVSGASTYRWNTNQTTQSISVTPQQTTTYSVSGTSVFGCKDSTSTQVVVYNNPSPIITPNTICSNELATLVATDATSFVWSDPTFVTDTVRPVVTSPQTYTVTATNIGGCIGTASLLVNPNPIVTATATDICQGESSTVSAIGAVNYDWSNYQSGAVISVSPSSDLTLSVVGYSEFGCKGYDTTMVVVHPTPDAGFALSSDLITIDEGEVFITDQSTDATIWNYNFGEYTNSDNTSAEQNPSHKYLSTGYFQVWQVVSTEFGCMDSTYKRVQIMAPYFFWVPNAFSPDNNGLNETFCPKGKGVDPNNYSMEIFDRWGNLLFKTNVPFECWNGFINGTKAPSDVYIYKINLKDLESHYHDYMGQFVIVR